MWIKSDAFCLSLIQVKAASGPKCDHTGMNLRMLFSLITALCTAYPLMAAERVFTVTGVVRATLDDGDVVIQHDDIPGYMPAMTMAFTPADPTETSTLKAGDSVRFRYRIGDDRSVMESVFVTGHAAPTEKSASVREKNLRVKVGDPVPPFRLVNEAGQSFTEKDLLGRCTVMTFIFTRCPVPEYCPAMAMKFGGLQDVIRADGALAKKVRLVSVTLDPVFDRPEILAAYGQAVGAHAGTWDFATGDEKEATALARAFSVYVERDGAVLNHTLCTALIGPDGRVNEIWRGNGWKRSEVVEEIRAALKDIK
jgi:protein SCO1